MRPLLTDRQREILNYIEWEVRTTGVPPSIRQIGVALGISSTNGVRAHLQALEKKGDIHRSSRTSRGIAALDRLRRTAVRALHEIVAIPILGQVTAGQPMLAVENRDGVLHLDLHLVHGTDTIAASCSKSSNGDNLMPVVPSDHGRAQVETRSPWASSASRSSATAPRAVYRIKRSNWSRRGAGIWVVVCNANSPKLA